MPTFQIHTRKGEVFVTDAATEADAIDHVKTFGDIDIGWAGIYVPASRIITSLEAAEARRVLTEFEAAVHPVVPIVPL